ncbi:hypothetical protein BHAMNSH16_08960 [Brachyspira hampsonii]|uniref:Uncharacterized protein n=1 Tax=Brachyspira hampsonii TaxID=1287055 RepID=A0AAC9XLC1_9SPIR|nr:hypothetical protein [Brachyspira hampsonii]ASJ21764.1 hypothetical protein BHAMNSH16_08960 [Brachyspira hampsonii]OEJ18781.1 hypothetical protein A9496_06120 [Brachyspira hampsonii]
MEKEEKFNPSWWVIIREGKKYIGCSNNCEHLEEKNGKMKCCYFEKEIEGEEDNYQTCEECFMAYSQTEFASPNMTTYDKRNHFKE